MSTISRRDFLKISGLALAGVYLPPPPPEEAPRQIRSLGRATKTIYVYAQPSPSAKPVHLVEADTVLNLYGSVESADEHYNRVWHAVQRGYVYAGHVQPVRWDRQVPSPHVPTGGFLGEITVPYTIARNSPAAEAPATYRFYYETTYWFTAAEKDETGQIWYRAQDERQEQQPHWVLGQHVRRVTAQELAPLSPDVQNKRIEINLKTQTFQCFEDDLPVLDTLCSTGIYLRTENGQRIYGTPAGDWRVDRKRLTRHMAGDDLAADNYFDLPGVPWVSYFHWWGVSIHGTYWHNDFGAPHSHGCINLPAATAKWVYRWTLPQSGLDPKPVTGAGTSVRVLKDPA